MTSRAEISRVSSQFASRVQRLIPVIAALLLACDSNPYDPRQVPKIRVTPVIAAPVVSFAWEPEGAALLRVYSGTVAGDGYSATLVWSIAATSRNSLASGVEYGTTRPVGGATDVAAKLLVPGAPYTVQISRADPKGKGDSFLGTSNRYVNTQTFTVAAVLPAP
jgi:hypothetical protein